MSFQALQHRIKSPLQLQQFGRGALTISLPWSKPDKNCFRELQRIIIMMMMMMILVLITAKESPQKLYFKYSIMMS